MLSPIEYLGMEKEPELLISYIIMIQFIYEHKFNNVLNIDFPERIIENNHLVLTNNSIRQLNLSENYSFYRGANDSLLTIVNKCKTAPGRRLCKERTAIRQSIEMKLI